MLQHCAAGHLNLSKLNKDTVTTVRQQMFPMAAKAALCCDQKFLFNMRTEKSCQKAVPTKCQLFYSVAITGLG